MSNFNAAEFLSKHPKPWDWMSAEDDGSFAIDAEQDTIHIEELLSYVHFLEKRCKELSNQIDRLI